MRFGTTLQKIIYPPWKDKYIDYNKLKSLLHDGRSQHSPIDHDDDDDWTEEDEGQFVEELVNVQLEKVHTFQASTIQRLRDETTQCEKDLEPLGVKAKEENGTEGESQPKDERDKTLNDVLARLDKISKETNELEKYSRINYTGFLKAAKKHDRRRGQSYRVGPLLRVRLAALPFNSEDYSPLLYRLSAMYSFVRQSLEGKDPKGLFFEANEAGADTYTAYKFWVHPENLLEVKTIILRRLPVLVYNPQTSKIVEGSEPDPTVTSIYFDNPKFSLYSKKVNHDGDASSLRLRWYGSLEEQTDILFEKKVIKESGESEEQRFPIKSKYINPFISGEYKMEKAIAKVERGGVDSPRAKQFREAVTDIQSFIAENKLQPVVRANYSRTAFEIPGDDRIRISLDTNLAFIREDAIDPDRPCRDPDDWHRRDIDETHMEYPFTTIHKGEINRFPFTVLEIKIRGRKQQYEWIDDLMSSHLVKEAPRFSKFIHGTANLFEDYVNAFPFWLGAVDTDIRTDPQTAYAEEVERRTKIKEEDLVVGSLFGSKASPARKGSMRMGFGSPSGASPAARSSSLKPPDSFVRATLDTTRTEAATRKGKENIVAEDSEEDDMVPPEDARSYGGLRGLFPSFSTSRYAQRHRPLPEGVTKPTFWLKDQGPVRVEAKVWLANQRTFIKWQHVTVLLASLSLGLYNAAGENNAIARALAVVYTAFAVFAGCWGYGVYMWRSKLIRTRSPRDFDNRLGPVVVCGGLAVALVLNFIFKFQKALEQRREVDASYLAYDGLYPHAGEL